MLIGKHQSGNDYPFGGSSEDPYVSCTVRKYWYETVPAVGKPGDKNYKPAYQVLKHEDKGTKLKKVASAYRGAKYQITHYGRSYLKVDGASKVGQFRLKADAETNDNFIIETDSSGTFSVSKVEGMDLEYKTVYYAAEVAPAPDGYLLYNDGNQFKLGKPVKDQPNIEKELAEKTERGHIVLEKVDEDTGEKMNGFKFKFYNPEYGWVVSPGTGMEPDQHATYSDDESEATWFKTGDSGIAGQIVLNYMEMGTYYYYEALEDSDIPEYYKGWYGENHGEGKGTLTTNGETKTITARNRQTWVSIEGRVFIDGGEDKATLRNNLWDVGQESCLDGVEVKLITVMKDGKIAEDLTRTTTTKNGGYYRFDDIEVPILNGEDDSRYTGADRTGWYCYITFEYNGFIYEAVVEHPDIENGSKAKELAGARDALNAMFAKVEGVANVNNQVQARDEAGNETVKVGYDVVHSNEATTATVTSTTPEEKTKIMASTQGVTSIKVPRGAHKLVLTGYNLGVYKRADMDVAILKDVSHAEISVKGEHHIYKYGHVDGAISDTTPMWDNVGVAFVNKYANYTYKQPIYRADALYTDSNTSNELKVTITYKIVVKNQGNKTVRIHAIKDYYDKKYTVEGVYSALDSNLRGTTDPTAPVIGWQEQTQPEGSAYKGTQILFDGNSTEKWNNRGLKIEKGKSKAIYVSVTLDRSGISTALQSVSAAGADITGYTQLGNIAEITSYTTLDDSGKYYAAVDKDAVADNITPGTANTYEDDTRAAPELGLIIAESRAVKGNVFEDLKENGSTIGNGIFDSTKESGMKNVTVRLMECVDSSVQQAMNIDVPQGTAPQEFKTTTDENGNYSFNGFTPGTYIVRFEWGKPTGTKTTANKVIDVVDYKSTIMDKTEYNNCTNSVSPDLFFYRKYNAATSDQNKSRALDDWNKRLNIDTNLMNRGESGYNYTVSPEDIKKDYNMTSDTFKMKYKLEYADTDGILITQTQAPTDTRSGKLQFLTTGINLGIIERPKQDIEVEKRISNIKVTYSSEEPIVDAVINSNGTIGGTKPDHISYITPNTVNSPTDRRYKQIKIELDDEILNNSIVYATYEYTIKNLGELDYSTQDFYYTGTQGTPEQRTYIEPIIMDYLGKEGNFSANSSKNATYMWTVQNIDSIKEPTGDGRLSSAVCDSNAIKNTTMYQSEYLKDKPIYSGGTNSATMYMEIERHLSTEEMGNINNQVELININRPFGASFQTKTTPGNYIPVALQSIFETGIVEQYNHEPDDAPAEQILIVSSTGGNRNYNIYIIISLTILITVAGGIYAIKKNKKE